MKKFFTYRDLVVPPHHPRVVFETAVRQGADRALLLANTGITPRTLESPDARLSYRQFGILANNALELTKNPALGLDCGHSMRPSHMGVLGLAVLSSPTVGAALQVALRHYRAVAPAWDLALLLRDDRVAVLSAREAIPLRTLAPFATECLLSAIDSLGRMLHGGPLPVQRLRLPYPRPTYAVRYEELSPSVEFDHEAAEAEFDAALLDSPIAGADPATARLAEEYCDRQGSRVAVDGLIGQMRRRLGASRGAPPDLEELARSLQTSTRTLRRCLQTMRTSYSELLDESRRSRAEEWVRISPMTFDTIASELGFSSVRSFRRAFKRWTGETPGAVRAAAVEVPGGEA